MAGDSVSLPTTIVHADTVSRIQLSAATDQQAQEKFAKKLQENSDEDTALLKNLSEAQRVKLRRRRREEESRKKREERRRAAMKKSQDRTRGRTIDLKV